MKCKTEYEKNFPHFYETYLTGIATTMSEFYINKLGLDKKTGHLLDLMCGTGTLLNIFSNHGWTGTGVDLSIDMLNIAKSKNNQIVYHKKDATLFNSDNIFDLVTCTADAVNHLPTMNDIDRLFSDVYNLLSPQGYFLF